MKEFVKHVGLGFLFALLVILTLEVYQSKVNNNEYLSKYKYMEDNSANIKTLILGNSLMENSINPHLLGDSVFDLAISARWIYYDKELLERYIVKSPNLKNVIFGMGYAVPFWRSYHFPEENEACANEQPDYVAYQKYMYEKFMRIRYDRLPYYYWFGFARGFIDKESLFGTDSIPMQETLGYVPVSGQLEDWETIHNINPDIIFNPHAEAQIAEYMEYLREMARLCQLYKVRFIVITPPCHDSYNVNVKQEGLDILNRLVAEIQSEYPMEYQNYLQDEEFRTDSLYYNCSHLNSVGADMLALRVRKDFGL